MSLSFYALYVSRDAWREKAGRNETCRKVKNAHSCERLDFCDVAAERVTYKNICVPDWICAPESFPEVD